MPTFTTVTLGCKVNQYETEFLREGLLRLGYVEVVDGRRADLCAVNTCTVTSSAEAKSRKAIRRLGRKYPAAEIIVMGCYATRAAEEVAAMPGVIDVVTDKRQVPDLLGRLGLVEIPTGISTFGHRHRAYVKVQDGCRMECSYCIIPQVRPVLFSRPIAEVLEEIERLVAHGHREIVLTGIHLGHYGVDMPDVGHVSNVPESKRHVGNVSHNVYSKKRPDLSALARRIARLDGEFRVRISSIEAAEVTPELIAVVADHPDRVCPHLHISMQSGSDAVLRRMRRRWSSGRFVERCLQIGEALDHPALTTDVIVGFPGETDEDFAATCRAVEEVGFSKLHVFRFSPRQGTPAAEMPDQVPEAVKWQRAEALSELGDRLRRRYFRSLCGRALQVLVETPLEDRPGWLLGTSDRYAPVQFPGGHDLIGRLVRIIAGEVAEGRIRAAGPVLEA